MLASFASFLIMMVIYVAISLFFQSRLENRGLRKVVREFATSMEDVGFVNCILFMTGNTFLSAMFVAAGATPLAGAEDSLINETTVLPVVCVVFVLLGVAIFTSYRGALVKAEKVVADYNSRK